MLPNCEVLMQTVHLYPKLIDSLVPSHQLESHKQVQNSNPEPCDSGTKPLTTVPVCTGITLNRTMHCLVIKAL